MATVVELPRLSDTMEEGVVAKWHIKVGDKVKRGQMIAEIETDKATMEFESFDAGYVLQLVASEGDTLPLGAPIAVFGKQGENPGDALGSHSSKPAAPAEAAPAAAAPATPAAAPTASVPTPAAAEPAVVNEGDKRIPASPVARKLARENGLQLGAIGGSGPHGRIIKADVEKAIQGGGGASSEIAPPVSFSTEADEHGRPYAARADRPEGLSQMRKTIARRMTQAKQQIPHFYLTIEIDMEKAMVVRSQYNEAVEGTKVSVNDLVMMASAKALREFPRVNSAFTDNGSVEHGNVHVGVAIAVDDGLIVPPVRYTDQKSLKAISMEVRELGRRAKKKELHPNEMVGSTFTVSNLGMFGIEEFSAVVNPGEGAILAVGAVQEKAVVHDGKIEARRRMKATLSCDHRVINGAEGAKWLGIFQEYLENPMRLFT